ncbi:MAG: glycoside hydrolase family 32 protein [Bacteroidetes bacterium]|nr:glycoside hydrolase family 32 protein [Bacteroidota bacterium]
MKRLLLLPALLLGLFVTAQTPDYREPYRPQFHFSPAINWTNDPNGLVYYKGEYHIFYQYNPFDKVWGHMTWAHAVSKDLVHWQHLPIAIPEENGIMIFSGSCVADTNNTSGFGTKDAPPMVAVYTGHTDTNQSQCLAYSVDKGRTWKKYAGNPVLDLHRKDFRDPKVFWYAPKKYWVMLLVFPAEHIVQIYSSPNLKTWTHLSGFGPAGDTSDIWECPDLSWAPVVQSPGQKKAVLMNSVQSTMQYFIGSFDGEKYTDDNPAGQIRRVDYGPDYYAGITYNNLPAGMAPVSIGWANNWSYARDIPTSPWRSAMSLPRSLSVKQVNGQWVLLQQPIAALRSLREKQLAGLQNELLGGGKSLPLQSQQLEAELEITPGTSAVTGIRLAAGNGHPIEIGYDAAKQVLYVDRSKTAHQSFNKAFAEKSRFETTLAPVAGKVRLRVFFDHSIVEVFGNAGEAVMTVQLFPDNTDNGVELFSNNGNSRINSLKIWQLKSAW